MKKYIFRDVLTNETFEVVCNCYEVHSIEIKNEELSNWCKGRILMRDEEEL